LVNFGENGKSLEFPLQFTIYDSVSGLPEDWDKLAGDNIFLSTDYLKVLELSAPKNMTCLFIAVSDANGIAGIAISQFLDLSKVQSFGERDNCLKNKIRTFTFKRFASHVLILGNNMLTGQNTFRFADRISETEGLKTLIQSIEQIKKDLSKKKIKTHLTIWKDFPETETEAFKIPEFDNYYKFSTQPNMVFDIRDNWNSDTDYVADLNKKYRDQYKRAKKKSEGITKRKLSLDEIIARNAKIYELYLTVAKNAPFNTFYLNENHFAVLKELLQDKFLFYGYFIGDDLIGFDTLIKNGDSMDTYFLGYDENVQRDKMLYLNMLYNMIGYSVNKKFKRVIFARTALEIKSAVGAKPVYLFGFIKHSNNFLNQFMPKLFPFFEPEMHWQERHPFKD
jgi:predicted N-acyltransferase